MFAFTYSSFRVDMFTPVFTLNCRHAFFSSQIIPYKQRLIVDFTNRQRCRNGSDWHLVPTTPFLQVFTAHRAKSAMTTKRTSVKKSTNTPINTKNSEIDFATAKKRIKDYYQAELLSPSHRTTTWPPTKSPFISSTISADFSNQAEVYNGRKERN
ncbi:hypothetical protein M3Y98_00392600 [Aphelenchoides besseyi]|nr:hypothetical protein M3Y98_00392600 [Aphelenchoides besseyi]